MLYFNTNVGATLSGVIGYCATLVSDATLAGVLLAGMGARGVRCLAEMGAVSGRKAPVVLSASETR